MQCARSPGSGRGTRRASTTNTAADAPQPAAGPAGPVDTGGDFWGKMGTMFQGMEKRMMAETGRVVEEKIGLAFTRIDDLSSRLTSTEKAVEGFMGDLGNIVGKKVEEHLHSIGAAQPVGPVMESNGLVTSYAGAAKLTAKGTPPGATRSRSKSGDYWRCRCALRMRPVGEGDAVLAVRNYIKDYLRQDSKFIEDIGPFTVQRVPSGPGSKIKDEAIVTFSSVEARDAVKGTARNLAGLGQSHGIRHEVPNHLKSDLKALHSMSYHIKQKHAEARRNVLFDDESMTLVLDVCLSEGGQWRRITAAQARSKSKSNIGDRGLAVDDEELDSILASPK